MQDDDSVDPKIMGCGLWVAVVTRGMEFNCTMFVNQIYVKLFSFFAHYHPLTVIAGIYFDLQTDQMEEKEILVLKT